MGDARQQRFPSCIVQGGGERDERRTCARGDLLPVPIQGAAGADAVFVPIIQSGLGGQGADKVRAALSTKLGCGPAQPSAQTQTAKGREYRNGMR